MVYYTVHYGFSQRFPFPARRVYDWATDFTEDDIRLMHEEGRRQIERLDDSTMILTDVTRKGGQSITKIRLVRLFPERLMWTNTRLSDAGKHSQFIYQVVAEGKNASRLDFTGAQVEEAARKPSKAHIASLSKMNAKTDSLAWVHLAKALEDELAPRR